MKRTSLIHLVFLATSILGFGQNDIPSTPALKSGGSSIQLNDSILSWQWNTLTGRWKSSQKVADLAYNANNELTKEILLKWDGRNWVKSEQHLYFFDENNSLIQALTQKWNGSNWVNQYQNTRIYDTDNNLIIENRQEWKGSGWVYYDFQMLYSYDSNKNRTTFVAQFWSDGAWLNVYKVSQVFNKENSVTSYLEQNWNNGGWENVSRSTYSYLNGIYLLDELLQRWQGMDWVNEFKTSYGYDANNRLISILEQNWNINFWMNSSQELRSNDANGNFINSIRQYWNVFRWENSSQMKYSYDLNKNLTDQLEQSWIDSSWQNVRRTLASYDGNNNQVNSLTQSWRNNLWKNDQQYVNTYNANNQKMSYVNKFFNLEGSILIGGDSSRYYPKVFAGINEFPGSGSGLSIYPNPTNGPLVIENKSPILSINIFNLSGEKMNSHFKFHGQEIVELDLSGFRRGIYFLHIYDGVKRYNRKILVQ
jgi:hypothetical protein